MERFFRLQEHGTSVSKELLCGLTTFLTMSYILFVNPVILGQTGMSQSGTFTATAVTAAMCSIIMGLVANAPFGMAPGMGLNTFFAYTVCLGMGFAWQEGLVLVLCSGLLHMLTMLTGLRKSLINAIPQHLKMSFGVGLGLFIAYVGLKNGGFLSFTLPAGQYVMLPDGTVFGNASAVPGIAKNMGGTQLIALIGLGVTLSLLALEKKTGETYAALPMGILAATFVGIPMNITDLLGVKFISFSALGAISDVFMGLWGSPGIFSVFSTPHKALLACLIISVLFVTNVMDSVGTVIGAGKAQQAEIFTDSDLEAFSRKGTCTRMDKTLMANSIGGGVSAIIGTTTATTYMESITGIVAGGRTGLTSITVGLLFIICLPLSSFFSIVPAAAIAPALIVAGAFMVPLAGRIQWNNFEEAFPAFATAMCIPLTYGIVYGIAAGVLSHMVIHVAMGKRREVHPMLYAISLIFIAVLGAESWM